LEPIFIAGGFNWPWVDDSSYINQLSEILERRNIGEIRIYGGRFALKSRTDDILREYKNSSRIKNMGVLPYEKLLNSYSEGSVGLLCFEKNLERHFSFNFRAMDYLASGLPVIVSDYLQISELIKKYDAGWVIKDREDFAEVVDRIISDNELVLHKSDNVTALVMQEFDANKNIEPLLSVINRPEKIKKREGLIQGLIRIVDRYVREGVEHADFIKELKKLEAENIRLNERITTKDFEILRLNNEKTDLLRDSGWLKDEVKRLSDERSRLKEEIMRLKNERDRLESNAVEANSKLTDMIRKNGFLEDEVIRLKNERNLRDDEIISLKNEIVELKKSITSLEAEIQKRDIIIGELRKKEAELEGIKSLPMYKLYKKVF
jgi:DNA repair exonuclease SbcCD ATPase subunit